MNRDNTFFVSVIVVLSLVEIAAMYFLKRYNLNGNMGDYFCGFLLYFIAINIFVFLFNYGKIGIVNISWNVLSSLLGVLLGYVMFKEGVTTAECIGVFISVIGLILMNVKIHP